MYAVNLNRKVVFIMNNLENIKYLYYILKKDELTDKFISYLKHNI